MEVRHGGIASRRFRRNAAARFGEGDQGWPAGAASFSSGGDLRRCNAHRGGEDWRCWASDHPGIPASENIAARVIEKLRALRLIRVAELVETAVEETLAYYAFLEEHWRRIRIYSSHERIHPGRKPSASRLI